MDKLTLDKKQVDSIFEFLNGMNSRFPKNESGNQHDNDSQNDEDEIDLGELIGTLIDSKWLIILITSAILFLGVAKALLDSPIYKLDALLQIEENSNSLGDLNPMEGLMDTQTPVQAEIAIIKSRMVLGEAVDNLRLDITATPKYFPIIGKAIARRFNLGNKGAVSSPQFGYSDYAWGGERIKINQLSMPSSLMGEKITLIAGENGWFKVIDPHKNLITEGQVAKLINVIVKDEETPFRMFISVLTARPGTHFTLSKSTRLNAITELQKRLSVSEQDKKTGILNFTMESAKPAFAVKTLNDIANIYVRLNVERKSEEAQKTLIFLEQQLPKTKDRLETSTTALNEYRLQKGSVNLNIETEGILEGVVELRTQITFLQQKKDELHRNFTAMHPSVIAINKQIVRLKTQLLEHNKKIGDLPKTQQVILRLSRDVKVDTELYTALLNQLQTIKVTKAGTVGDVRIIDYAVLPTIPIKPKKALIVAVALILGLILGIATAFIRKALRHGVEDPSVIENHLNVPVYATVPLSDFQTNLTKQLKKNKNIESGSSHILAIKNGDDPAIESLRSLRTTLHFAFLEAKNNIIMISGPSPGIGKSFVSTNLAVILADSGKKVLLIDADMRKGLINKVLGIERENGLSDLISGSITSAEAINKIEDAKIDFISTGEIPPNPSELLLHERFGELLKVFSEHYDQVIIDSPPILAVTDASIIGRHVSATLLVVKAGQHPLKELQLCMKRFNQNDVEIKGVIFNGLSASSSGYGYGYGYEKYSYN